MNPLKQKRFEKGMTVVSVALAARVARQTLTKYEECDAIPPAGVAKALADYYECSITDLWPPRPVKEEAA